MNLNTVLLFVVLITGAYAATGNLRVVSGAVCVGAISGLIARYPSNNGLS
jgi:hypothetical protein